MPPERWPPDDPREWLNRARGNLPRAKTVLPEFYLEDLCFDAQQAAEKAIEAVLIARGVDFPLVHDLERLLNLLGESGESIPPDVADAKDLTRFAAAARYPGVTEPVTAEEHRRAVAIAEAVVAWAEGRVGKGQSGAK